MAVFRRIRVLWSSRHPAWVLARVVLLVIVGLFGYLMIFENSFIYYPEKYPVGDWEVNRRRAGDGQLVARAEDVWMTAPDGVKIHGWLCRPFRMVAGGEEAVPVAAVLLWCHGNGGNLTHRFDRVSRFVTFPVAVFVFDYRGYGRSEGSPSEEGLYLDTRTAWETLIGRLGFAPEEVVIYGVSLGGAPAVNLAAEVPAAGLIVESTFTSIPDMAAATMPWVPRTMVRTRMDSAARIAQVAMPKLHIHSPDDEVIPYALGKRLYELAPEPKTFHEVEGAGHNETDLVGGEAYFGAIREFVFRVTGEATAQ